MDPNSNTPLVNAGYQIARTDIGNKYGVPVNDPIFQAASDLIAAAFAAGLTPEAPEAAPGDPLRAANMGNKVHYDRLNGGEGDQLPSKLQTQYPDTEFRFARRGQSGPDVEVVGGTHPSDYPGSSWAPGNDFGDFKPGTANGSKTFAREE